MYRIFQIARISAIWWGFLGEEFTLRRSRYVYKCTYVNGILGLELP